MACDACPFAFTDISEAIQNLARLPTPSEAMQIMRDQGLRWCCHEDETKPCAGQAEYCQDEGIAYDKYAPLASYTNWFHHGKA